MANGKDICCIPECDEEVKYVHLQVCSACYSGLALWRGRPIAQKRRRMEINKRLVSRMDFIMDNPKHHPVRRDDLDRGDRKTK
jgi:hypothetical protein